MIAIQLYVRSYHGKVILQSIYFFKGLVLSLIFVM